MDKKRLFDYYEKYYFHEIDYRDKITARLQLPLAIFLSFISLLGYMIKNINFGCNKVCLIMFIIFFVLSSILIIMGIIFFIKAFYGHTYEFMPTANETEKYRKELDSTYEGYENTAELSKKYLESYIYQYYHECSSANSKVNDLRSENIHRANTLIILTVLPLLITFLIFHFSGIDKSVLNKNLVFEMEKPLDVVLSKEPIIVSLINDNLQQSVTIPNLGKGGLESMVDKEDKKTPPPPPKPPPKRLVREDLIKGNVEKEEKQERNE